MIRRRVRANCFVPVALAVTLWCGSTVPAQERGGLSDEEARYLRELDQLNLEEVMDRYLLLDAGGDPVEAAERKIAFRRAQAESAPTGGTRERRINRVLELRAALIDDHPSHPHRGRWLVEQALDAWIELAAVESSELVTLLGMPSDAQRERAARAAEIAFDAARRAEIEIRDVLLELESTPGYAENLQLQLERRELAETERDRRIPYLLGIVATLHAEWNLTRNETRDRTYRVAVDILRPLMARLDGATADRGRFYLGWSLMRLGEFAAARDAFRAILASESSAGGVRLMASLGDVRRVAAERGLAAGLARLEEVRRDLDVADRTLFTQLLLADNVFLLRREQAMARDGEARERALAEAFNAYLVLLDAHREIPAETLRSIVFARLLAAVDAQTPLSSLPPVVAIARGAQLAKDPATADEAVALLGSVLDQQGLPPREAALALRTWATALQNANQPLEAARSFIQFAREYPRNRDAEQAITVGLALAAEAMSVMPDAGRTLVQDGLTVLFEQYPNLPAIDTWRLWAARLALAEGRYNDAIEHAGKVTPDAAVWLESCIVRIEALRARLEARPGAVDPVEVEAFRAMLTETRAAVDRAAERDAIDAGQTVRWRDELMLHVAAADLLVGEHAAVLEWLDSVTEAELAGDLQSDAMLLRFRVLEADGRLEEAHAALDAYLKQNPGQTGAMLSPMVGALRDRVERLRGRGEVEQADRVAERELFPVAERFHAWLVERGDVRSRIPEYYVLAEAFRIAGACSRAVGLYEQLLEAHPGATQFLLGRAECLFQQGDDALVEAMRVYRRLVGAAGDSGQTYWLCQLRTLQILDRTGRNTHQILPRIQQLRQRDPALGGEGIRRELERLQNKYADRLP